MLRKLARFLGLACVGIIAIARPYVQGAGTNEQEFEAIRSLLTDGEYTEAERQSRRLEAAVEARDGPDSLTAARALDLLVGALVQNGKGTADETLRSAERALHLKEKFLGPDHVDVASSVHNLADVYVERAQFNRSVGFYQLALSTRERWLPRDAPAIADTLDGLANAFLQLQRLDEARRVLTRARTIREANGARSPLALAGTLELSAWLDRYSGDYGTGMSFAGRAVETRSRLFPNHPRLVTAREVVGDLQWLQGDPATARQTWADDLQFGERVLGPEHPNIPALLRRLAMAARVFGEADAERQLLERGLSLSERVLAPCHPEVAWLLNDTAASRKWDGDYVEAQKLFRRARMTIEECFGPDHANVATALHNQASLANAMGDFPEAERLQTRAVAVWSAALGPNHPFVARGLDALGDTLVAQGANDRARVLYERALAIKRRSVGSTHPDVAWTLTNLAQLRLKAGALDEALALLNEAIDIYQQGGESDDPDHLARVLMLRARVQLRYGRPAAARESLVEAIAIRDRAFGSGHPIVADSRAQLAITDFALGAYGPALEAALQAERDARTQFRFTIRYLSERKAMTYSAARPQGLDLALSIVADGKTSDLVSVFDALIQSRGLILEELGTRSRSTTVVDPGLAELNAKVVSARSRFANLMLRSLEGEEPVPRLMLDDARQQKEEAEREFAERSAPMQTELAQVQGGFEEVRHALPPSTVLVSFARYNRMVVSKSGTPTRWLIRTVPSYLAFVVHADSSNIAAIPLGSASSIDPIVKEWHDEAAGRSIAAGSSEPAAANNYRRIGDRLRWRIWDPIAGHLANTTRVFVIPDGALNVVSFAALPARARHFLGERFVLHYASAERDLIGKLSVPASHGLLAVGGPAFDGPAATLTATSGANRPVSPVRGDCRDLHFVHFDALPGSQREASQVARIWSEAFSAENTGEGVTVLTGTAATKSAVKSAAVGRRVVHLATHGFFLGASCEPQTSGTRAIGGISTSAMSRPPSTIENPLLLSGLAFAGANRRARGRSDEDDGIVTAEEVAGMNLQGTEWAVLSACDTGLGEIKAGEGVFGLRRAFQIAGARTVIMSMWAVDDQAAQAWMRALYDGRFNKHLNTSDAVHEATLTVLRTRRARGQSTHPLYWAGFVAAGDWR